MVIYDENKQILYIPSKGDKIIYEDYEEKIQEVYQSGYTAGIEAYYADHPYERPLTFRITGDGVVVWKYFKETEPGFARTIEYQLNYGPWEEITSTTDGTEIPVSAGDVVCFRGDNEYYGSNTFSGTSCGFNIQGNIMSLLSSACFASNKSLGRFHAVFMKLFKYCTGLIDASGLFLPATNITEGCYQGMFEFCNNLLRGPELPATSMAEGCYRDMFFYCGSLVEAPALPATTLAERCYYGMFEGCENLKTAPELPSRSLAKFCYMNMFSNCASLLEAPALPATSMEEGCYADMFLGCRSLEESPLLPAQQLAKSCYSSMFAYCGSLKKIACLATDISADSCTRYFTYFVQETGTFVKNSNMNDWTTGFDGIPSGWTVVDAE